MTSLVPLLMREVRGVRSRAKLILFSLCSNSQIVKLYVNNRVFGLMQNCRVASSRDRRKVDFPTRPKSSPVFPYSISVSASSDRSDKSYSSFVDSSLRRCMAGDLWTKKSQHLKSLRQPTVYHIIRDITAHFNLCQIARAYEITVYRITLSPNFAITKPQCRFMYDYIHGSLTNFYSHCTTL